MPFQAGRSNKGFAALLTAIGFLSGMNPLVPIKLEGKVIGFATLFTFVKSISGMNPLVLSKVC